MKIEIISPEKTVKIDDAKMVTLPAHSGEMGILEGHAPAVVVLKKGKIKIIKDTPMNIILFNPGYAHITSEKLTILLEDF